MSAISTSAVSALELKSMSSLAAEVNEKSAEFFATQLVLSFTSLSWETLPSVVLRSVELVESFGTMTGSQKKAMVIFAIQKLITKLDAKSSVAAADPVFQAIVPVLIDQLVTVSKDGIHINMATPSSCFCFSK